MNLVRLHTKGFMAYKNEMTIKFGPGLTYILGENLDNPDHACSNGAAKTTVLYALLWMLWGKIPAEHTKNDLIHLEASGVYGELELAGEGESLKIVRHKTRSGSEKLTFAYNGESFELDMPQAQQKLESFYGLSYDTFCIAERSMVMTDQGERGIETLSPGDSVLTRVGWRRVQHVTCTGVRQTMQLEFSNGRHLLCTPDHRVCTTDGWVQARDLTPQHTLLGLPITDALPPACPAVASSSLADPEVVSGQGVTVGAGGLFGVAASNVLSVCDRLQMTGVTAPGVLAEVVQLQSGRDRPFELSVDIPVDLAAAIVGTPHGSVALTARGSALPQPTVGAIEDRPRGDASFEPLPCDSGHRPVIGTSPAPAGDTVAVDSSPAVAVSHVRLIRLSNSCLLRTWDIGVEGEHEFFCEGVLVHNCNSIFIAPFSKATQFVQAQPAKRAQILSELIDDSLFQAAAKEIGNDLTRAENQIRVNESLLSRIESDMGRCQTDLLRLEAQVQQESLRVQEQQQADQKAIFTLMEEQALLQRELNTPVKDASITDLQVEINGLNEESRKLLFEMGKHDAIRVGRIFQGGEACPTCQQMVPPEQAHRLTSGRAAAAEKVREISKVVAANNRRVDELTVAITRVQNEHALRRQKEGRVKDLQAQIVSLRSKGETRTAVDVLLLEKTKTAERYQELKKEADENRAATEALRNRMPFLKNLKSGFGTEIRDMMFDDLRRVLAYYTDKYRWLLAGNEFEIDFPVERGKFDIVIKVNGVKKPLPSTGENWRATFAILLALKRALTYGNRGIFDFLLVDDPFQGGLDDTGIRVFSRLLESLKQEIPQTLVTLPRKVQDMAEGRTLVARRQNRASQLVGG